MLVSIIKDTSFEVGETLTVTGISKPDAAHFAVNIGPNEQDRALHVDIRFDYFESKNTVVCNSCQGGSWGAEQYGEGFPFGRGKKFKVVIKFNSNGFVVTLPDDHNIKFPNRLGAEKYSVITVNDDAHIKSIIIE